MWLVLFAAYAAGVGLHASPGEGSQPALRPTSCCSARSIVDDGDLDLSDEYGAAAWRPFYGGTLVPLTGPRERGGARADRRRASPCCARRPTRWAGRLAVELRAGRARRAGLRRPPSWIARRMVPDPWATGGALAVGLSPPAVVAATTIAPDAVAASALAGAAALALAARERPLARLTAWAGTAAGHAALAGRQVHGARRPWSWPACIAWPRRRQRGLAGLVGVEVALFLIRALRLASTTGSTAA